MKGFGKITAGVFLAAVLTGSVGVANTAHASSEGRKNTAIALGAVAVHQLLKGKTTNGVVAGAAAAAAYKRYKDAKKDEDRNGRRRSQNDRDWFDRLTGQNKDQDDRYRRDRNRDNNTRYRNDRNRENVRYRRDTDRERVSRRNEDHYRDRYDTRNDRYEQDRYDRYDD